MTAVRAEQDRGPVRPGQPLIPQGAETPRRDRHCRISVDLYAGEIPKSSRHRSALKTSVRVVLALWPILGLIVSSSKTRDRAMDPIPLVGYADRFSCAPGDQIAFKVSCHSQQPYRASLVRVISCDPNPEGPGVIEHPIASEIDGEYRSRVQEVRLGSHIEVQTGEALTGGGRFKISALIWPTSISAGLQGVVTLGETNANRSISLAVSQQGATLKCGETEIQVSKPMVERRWYRAWMTVAASACSSSTSPTKLSAEAWAPEAKSAAAAACASTAPLWPTVCFRAWAAVKRVARERSFSSSITPSMMLSALAWAPPARSAAAAAMASVALLWFTVCLR